MFVVTLASIFNHTNCKAPIQNNFAIEGIRNQHYGRPHLQKHGQ